MHLRCEICGGPENWCFDRAGEVWTRCMDEGCLAHQQMDLWPEEPFWPEGVVTDVRGPESIDRSAPDPVTKPFRGSETVLPF